MRFANLLLLIPIFAPFSALADDAGSLPPEQYHQGWVRLYDGLSTAGWASPSKPEWISDNECLTSPAGATTPIYTTSEFGDFELQFEYQLSASASADLLIRAPSTQIREMHDAYDVRIVNMQSTQTGWTRMNIRAQGAIVSVFSLDSQNTITNRSKTTCGRIAVVPVSGKVAFRNVRLRPLGPVALFDGGSLADWNTTASERRLFTVTKDAALNARGGRGDIWRKLANANCILQCEAVCNIEHSTGGIKLLEDPARPASGLEISINNDVQGIDRTKPLQYGTGGVYGRVPAREVVSTDKDWCALTIAVTGDHVDVWVNGYYVAGCDRRRTSGSGQVSSPSTSECYIALSIEGASSDISFRKIQAAYTLDRAKKPPTN